jgi:hypothetical protein
MTTSIDIANRALILLGGREITSFIDGTNESKIAKSTYGSTRDYVLRAYPWASLKKRVDLVELLDKPISGYSYQYQIPNDSVRVISVHTPQRKIGEWEVNGTMVLANAKPISIVYLSDTVPEQNYSTQLIQALVYRMAAEMAYAMTGSNQAQVNFTALFDKVLDEARTTDALEQSSHHVGPSNLQRVRM